MLQIMTEKGLVERDETVRPQIYRARTRRNARRSQLLRDLIQRAFGGSVKALVMQALATTEVLGRGSGSYREAAGSIRRRLEMTAITQAVTEALFHFVWQGTLVAFLLWMTLFLLRR